MKSLLFAITLCICFFCSVTHQQTYFITNAYANTTTCSGAPSLMAFQNPSCQSGYYEVCGTNVVQQFKCSGANCTSCTQTNIPVNQCIPNTTSDFSLKFSCGAFSLPSGYAAVQEYITNANCAGNPSSIAAYRTNVCLPASGGTGGYVLITCSASIMKASRCSDASCSQNCQSEGIPTGACEPAGPDASVNFLCNP